MTFPTPLRPASWTDADIPDDTATEAPEQPAQVVALQGGTLSVLGQVKTAFAHAFRTGMARSRELSEREGGMVHGLLGSQPPSVTGQHEYAKSRAWVPPGHDGGIADRAGTAYHWLLGRPGVVAGNLISAVFARPLRFFLTLIVVTAAVYLISHVL